MPRTRKLWHMKGCSRKKMGGCNCALWGGKRSRKWTGGSPVVGADFNLAYTGTNRPMSPLPNNPYLAYTGAGTGTGSSCGMQSGGMGNGVNNIVPAPLEGSAWSDTNWPGQINNVDATQYGLNTYPDPQADRILFQERIGTTFPIKLGGKKRRTRKYKKHTHHVQRRKRYGRRSKRRGGGGISGVFSQMGADLGNAYNTLQGYPPGPNPMPYSDQYAPQDNLAYLHNR